MKAYIQNANIWFYTFQGSRKQNTIDWIIATNEWMNEKLYFIVKLISKIFPFDQV